ncbi:MAG: nodulation protein NfeD [Chloroflexi bacterium]|nr:nodulation protein NfeD [Chloroflexota bacterium]
MALLVPSLAPWRRRLALLIWAVCLAWAAASQVAAAAMAPSPPHGLHLRVEGIIDPFVAGYVKRGLQRAEGEGAALVVIGLDTPGGLDSSMRKIVQSLLNSQVPTVVYVSPAGARAASAGVFIAAAANVAAMAPGTNLGAAHPVGVGAELPETLAEKATNDAAALIRGIAAERGRNAQWLEEAVRRSVAAAASEAVELGVIDLVAATPAELLAQLHGRRVTTPRGSVVLESRGLELQAFPMNWPERLLHVLANPDIAFLLISLGSLALLLEFLVPGHVVPGIMGAFMLLIGFTALGSLPVNWGGMALLALGIIFLVIEALTPGFGAFGLAGLAAFVLGAFFLFTPFTPVAPALPQDIRIRPWLIGAVSAAVFAVFIFYISAVIQARRRPPVTALAVPVGATGVATSDLAPRGTVQAASELWSAETVDGEPVRRGEAVEVMAAEGLVLKVRRVGRTAPEQ